MDNKYLHLRELYNEVRRKWLDSENTEFDNELADFFDELEDAVFEIPHGN